MIALIIISAIGFCISIYAYIVEKKIKVTPEYKPYCDLSDRISCSKPLKSKYSNLFFISNSIAGMIYYLIIIVLNLLNLQKLLLLTSTAGFLVSIGLGYLLYFKIKSFCFVCTSIYFVNFLIFIIAILKFYR